MRPKFLEIEGLQSFQEVQRIDFNGLGETGLFGIFGPTGSGKSTVLDAITFALYGRVKRAERGTQGIINSNLNTAKVSFTFELLKDSVRKTYRVERTYRRKKGSDNSCEPKVARLIEVTGVGETPLCDKASEVSSSIEELLGLSHDDFTRAVVLPQNSFQEFLMLDNARKREMLERIFYLEEHGKQLWEKLNRKMSGLKSRIDMISGELAAYADASDEALEKAGKTLEEALLAKAGAERDLKLLEARCNEAREVWQLVQELAFISDKEERHTGSKEDVYLKKQRLEKAVKADGLLEMICKNKELSSKLRETEELLQGVMDRLPGVISELDDTRRRYEDVRSQAAAEQPKLLGMKTRLLDALGIRAEIKEIQEKASGLETVAAGLKEGVAGKSGAIDREKGLIGGMELQLTRFHQEMAPLQTDPGYRQLVQEGSMQEHEVEALKVAAFELEGKAKTLDGVLDGLDERLGQVRQEILLSQKNLDALDEERKKHEGLMPEDRNAVLQYREEIHNLQAVRGVLEVRKKELDGMKSRLTALKSTLEENEVRLPVLEEERAQAGRIYEQALLEHDQALKEMDRNAACQLSKNLKDGEPCPVCGSESHPKPAGQVDGADLKALEQHVENASKRLAETEKAFKEAEKACLIAGEQVKNQNNQVRQLLQELELKKGEYDREQLGLPAEMRLPDPDQLHAAIDRMKEQYGEKLKTIGAWEKKQEEYRAGMQKIRDQLSGYRLEENGTAAEHRIKRESRGEVAASLQAVDETLREKQKKHLDFLNAHKIRSAEAELKRLSDNDRTMNIIRRKSEETQQSLKENKINLDLLKEDLLELNRQKMEVQKDLGILTNQIREKETRLKELAGDADIGGEISRIDMRLDEYIKLEKQRQGSIKVLESRFNELNNRQSILENQRNIYTASLKSEDERLRYKLLEQGFADSGEVEEAIMPKEMQRAFKEEVEKFKQEEINIRAHKGRVSEQLGPRSITEEEWEKTKNAYQDMAAFKEESVSRSVVAINIFNTLKDRHDRWLELNRDYTGLVNRQGLYEQIQKLLRAEKGRDNSFIDFIAEERLRYIAARASETLGLMTGYKYALELDAGAGFIIRDNANGGVHRMVSSLSGGETFLTSLSLALALSEQIQLKGQSPLEFFFLDEGFGTLDNDLLDSVIDSLERLSNKERVIGIISHVPELRSRIARRLFVDPPSFRGNGSRVRIEKA